MALYEKEFRLQKQYYHLLDKLFHTDKAEYFKRVSMISEYWIDLGFPLDKLEEVKISDVFYEFERCLRDNSVSRASLIVEFNKLKNAIN
jgi:hypothetical protein